MDIFTSMQISSSALSAQRTRLNVISSNLANVGTTRTAEGGPYRKRQVIFQSSNESFAKHLDNANKQGIQGVKVAEIQVSQAPLQTVYEPGHPDADENGMVHLPNVNTMEEMVDMMNATRTYEANASAIQASKRMALKALEIGR
ncbi:MAG: flagellar basal body rod protein FlgC [Desulfuromonadales bacterium C00003096]|nr:MAG: flagellar basal body rod protein FlgC [Desulfuromonadales bacterium C00003096]